MAGKRSVKPVDVKADARDTHLPCPREWHIRTKFWAIRRRPSRRDEGLRVLAWPMYSPSIGPYTHTFIHTQRENLKAASKRDVSSKAVEAPLVDRVFESWIGSRPYRSYLSCPHPGRRIHHAPRIQLLILANLDSLYNPQRLCWGERYIACWPTGPASVFLPYH